MIKRRFGDDFANSIKDRIEIKAAEVVRKDFKTGGKRKPRTDGKERGERKPREQKE